MGEQRKNGRNASVCGYGEMVSQELPKLPATADFSHFLRKSSPETILLNQKAGFRGQIRFAPRQTAIRRGAAQTNVGGSNG